MKKNELKQVLKPLIKECIKEVMFEEGVLSGIISEVVKGLGTNTIVEQRQPVPQRQAPLRSAEAASANLRDTKSKMLDAIGKDSYNGINLFEGTDPIAGESNQQSPLANIRPGDPGVDISSLMRKSALWKTIANGGKK